MTHTPARETKRPTDEQIGTAIEWLNNYEGNGDSAEIACKAVAEFLDAEMTERMLRSEARKAGVPIAVLRRKLAERSAT